MEPRPLPDRATAQADELQLANLDPDAACDLPAGRVRAYVDAYLGGLPAPAPTEARPADKLRRWRELVDQPSDPAVAGRVFARPQEMWAPPVPPRLAKRGVFWPSTSMYVVAAIGVAFIVLVSLLLDGWLEKVGEGGVAAVLGARAFVLKLQRDIGKDDPDPRALPGPLAALSWTGGILSTFAFLASGALLFGIFYGAPRLVGVKVDPWAPGSAALLIVGLLAVEWGLYPEDA